MGDANILAVYLGDELAKYGFGDGHPFGPDRQAAFIAEFESRELHTRCQLLDPVAVDTKVLECFHTAASPRQRPANRHPSGQAIWQPSDRCQH